MKNPYGKIIELFIDRFAGLGFSRTTDDDYVVVFSGENCSIEISVEKYYVPSITTSFIDMNDEKYLVRLIREVLDSERFTADIIKLDAVEQRYRLDDESADEELRRKGIDAFIKLSFEQLLDFLSAKIDILLSEEDSFRKGYLEKENKLLGDLGL